MKKLIAISAMTLVMTGCISPEASATIKASAVASTQVRVEGPTLIEQAVITAKKHKMSEVISQLKSHVGKTWYVFSGATPSGWDCSGLVVWAYQQLGVEVPHSANKQGHIGKKVKHPRIGDIVVWSYKGSSSYYHASIYIGNGKVIHAGFRPGTTTSIINLDDPSFDYSNATFIRVAW